MNNLDKRYDRNLGLFGEEGQRKLKGATVTVVGLGGLGSPIGLQLAHLGIGKAFLCDNDELDFTSRNRFVGAHHDDPVPGSPKVELVTRLIQEINPEVDVVPIPYALETPFVFDVIKESNFVIGCLDHDGPRAILSELCSAYAVPYIDLASGVNDSSSYGGRIAYLEPGKACLSCLGELDHHQVTEYLMTDEQIQEKADIYGVPVSELRGTGPSVSPINLVVAGVGGMHLMQAITGLKSPPLLVKFHGHTSKTTVSTDSPTAHCYICNSVFGKREKADVERYLRMDRFSTRKLIKTS